MARGGSAAPGAGGQQRSLAVLRNCQRVWAVGAVHAQTALLSELHTQIAERWEYFDRIVYLGNLIGYGEDCLGTIDEVLDFRRRILAVPHAIPEDVVFLRGQQEEMWQKLLQLQFAADPGGVLEWLLSHGVGTTLEAYGGSEQEGRAEARHGALSLTRWTQSLRAAMNAQPGHARLFASLRRAAYSDDEGLLLVSAGLDPTRDLDQQGDSFWWGHPAFGAQVRHFSPLPLRGARFCGRSSGNRGRGPLGHARWRCRLRRSPGRRLPGPAGQGPGTAERQAAKRRLAASFSQASIRPRARKLKCSMQCRTCRDRMNIHKTVRLRPHCRAEWVCAVLIQPPNVSAIEMALDIGDQADVDVSDASIFHAAINCDAHASYNVSGFQAICVQHFVILVPPSW